METKQSDLDKRSMITRPRHGTCGQHISLLTNHFKVSIRKGDGYFYQYSVSISSEDDREVDGKVIGRKITDKLYQTYSTELAGKKFAYDGNKSLYTVGPLPQNKFNFTMVLDESIAKCNGSSSDNGSPSASGKRSKFTLQSRTFKVEISYAAKIPLKSIALALQGAETEIVQDSLRVLDIILRQQAAKR